MKILLTGASGFVGRYVCDAAPDKLKSSVPLRLLPWDRTIDGNLHRPGDFEAVLAKTQPHAVLHLAWTHTGVPEYEHSRENDQWLATTTRMINACQSSDTKFVGIGSCIEKPGNASTRYRTAKLSALEHAQNVLSPGRLTWLRPSWIVSVADHRPRILADLHQAQQRGELFKPRQPGVALDFVEVRDVATGILAALRNDLIGVQDIASGYGCPVGRLLEKVVGDGEILPRNRKQTWTVSGADILRLLDISWRPHFTRELLGFPAPYVPT